MKNKFFFFLVLIIILITETVSLSSKINEAFNHPFVLTVQKLFEKIENYFKVFHSKLINDFGVKPPYDILFVFLMGCVIRILIHYIFTKRIIDKYIYKTRDHAQDLYTILNVSFTF